MPRRHFRLIIVIGRGKNCTNCGDPSPRTAVVTETDHFIASIHMSVHFPDFVSRNISRSRWRFWLSLMDFWDNFPRRMFHRIFHARHLDTCRDIIWTEFELCSDKLDVILFRIRVIASFADLLKEMCEVCFSVTNLHVFVPN